MSTVKWPTEVIWFLAKVSRGESFKPAFADETGNELVSDESHHETDELEEYHDVVVLFGLFEQQLVADGRETRTRGRSWR